MLPYVSFVFTRNFLALTLAGAALGLFLVSRQWDFYLHSFTQAFTLEGAGMIALSLAFAKLVHEIGHGLAAKRFGCRVPAMGVALLVLWPLLWTDTTEAWKLTDRRQRMAIDAAGVAAELVLAVMATLAWCAMSDGPLRSGVFLLSSATWLVTVVVNLNPLMRFDGYYLLSDLLGVPNLQQRGFAMARWRLREWLFGIGAPMPAGLTSSVALILNQQFAIKRQYPFCHRIYIERQ